MVKNFKKAYKIYDIPQFQHIISEISEHNIIAVIGEETYTIKYIIEQYLKYVNNEEYVVDEVLEKQFAVARVYYESPLPLIKYLLQVSPDIECAYRDGYDHVSNDFYLEVFIW